MKDLISIRIRKKKWVWMVRIEDSYNVATVVTLKWKSALRGKEKTFVALYINWNYWRLVPGWEDKKKLTDLDGLKWRSLRFGLWVFQKWKSSFRVLGKTFMAPCSQSKIYQAFHLTRNERINWFGGFEVMVTVIFPCGYIKKKNQLFAFKERLLW
jgi:hypothetical protein